MDDTRKDIFKKIHERCFQLGSCNYKETGCSDCPINVTLVKAETLLDKQEQGLLKILPCPIGTLVHEPYKFCGDGAWEIDHHYLKLEDLDKIGKTVFVDENDAKAYMEKAEAEEALARMKGE